MVKEQRARRHK